MRVGKLSEQMIGCQAAAPIERRHGTYHIVMLNDAVAYRFEESCLLISSHNGYYVKLTFPIQRMTLAVLATLSISACAHEHGAVVAADGTQLPRA